MTFARSILHGFALTAVNVGAVLVGFAAYKILGVGHQLAVQIAVAVAISVAAFATWYYIVGRVTKGRTTLGSLGAYFWTYAFASGWLPAVFIPLHYVTQGYLTSFANIYNMWLFQAPTNALALAAAAFVVRRFEPRERYYAPGRKG
jgi:hypothetical protein